MVTRIGSYIQFGSKERYMSYMLSKKSQEGSFYA